MLELKNIYKSYKEERVLKDISMSFRKKEFVSVLGPSGSGKTTLLNIIGGLDKYDSGDLIINGKSTKKYKSKDWDSYRNKRIGFVFQNYNLIDHLSVLDNVKLSLTLSGLSNKLIKKKTLEVLKKVDLIEHIHKKPNQLSGGQMQRVAIARALVNDPDIIVADEPTGALDSNTSISIMNLLKEISNDKLVIMVTHNEALAKNYSSRIIRIEDGNITSDNNSYFVSDYESEIIKRKKNMSILTSLKLSFLNLLTKKRRTFLTSFASSIGIIGIALVLSINQGVNNYIDSFEKESISDYPIEINKTNYNLFEDISNSISNKKVSNCEKGKICVDDVNKNILYENNLIPFKKYIENNEEFTKYSSNIIYDYDVDLSIFNSSYERIDSNLLSKYKPNQDLKLIYGKEPSSYDEVAIIVNKNIISKDLSSIFNLCDTNVYSYTDINSISLKLVIYTDYFSKEKGVYISHENDKKFMKNIVDNGLELKVVGIYNSDELSSSVLYTSSLVDYLINSVSNTDMYKDKNLNIDLSPYDIDNPSDILIYPKDYKSKEHIIDLINEYNHNQNEDNIIKYTDLMKSFVSGISRILNIISYVLISVVAISLVVSSIMISIITYISVLERTKEIGILRSIGASKKDVRNIFFSENIIEGLLSGVIGILIAFLVSNIGNVIIFKVTNIKNILVFSYKYMFLLLALSILLCVISGLRPARIASKKNPVDSLRT